MSGFRNFNIPQKGYQTAVSSNANDEWDTAETSHSPFQNQQSSPNSIKKGVPVFPQAANEQVDWALNRKKSVTQMAAAFEQKVPENRSSSSQGRVNVPFQQQGQQKVNVFPGAKQAGFSVNTKKLQGNSGETQFSQANLKHTGKLPSPQEPSPQQASYPYAPSQTNKASFPTFQQPNSSSLARSNSQSQKQDVHIQVAKVTPSNVSTGLSSFKEDGVFNPSALAAKYPQFNASEISAFHQQFTQIDTEANDSVHVNDLASLATKSGASYQDVIAKLSTLNLSTREGHVTFEGFMAAVSSLRASQGQVKSDKSKIRLHGHSENITHTINEDEKESFVQHINAQLGGDNAIGYRFPIDTSSMEIFSECRDGLILAKLINDSVPGTIDERVLNLGKKLSPFQMTENNNVVVNSAKAIGCSVVNIGSQDLMEGREHLILGLIWQIIRAGLAAKVDIRFHPELFRLLEPGETLEEFLKLPTDKILLRWFNYHLRKAGWNRTVNNFSGDVKDGENYTVLLNQLAPSLCSRNPLRESDLLARAEMVLVNAEKLGCRKYLTPKSLVSGNSKLNFAFVANLFNLVPGLEPLSESEKAQLDDWLFGSEGDREARAFALWMNSLGVDPFINNLYDDVSDGLVLLQTIDHIHHGLVDWKKVNKSPVVSKFKRVENTNYVVVLGKAMRFTLVGIQGSDITDGVKILILGYSWQLMREHVIQTLKTLSKDGQEITESDLIRWANDTVRRGGRGASMKNFKDPSLHTGHFLLDLLNGMKRGIVDYSLVTNGQSDENAKMNAKYAISIARKLGATIFVLPEDIIEVKPKMILTFVGTLMALDKQGIAQ